MKPRSLFTFAISAFALSLSWAQTVHQGFAMDDHTKVHRLIGTPQDPVNILPLNCPAGSVLSGGVCVPLPTNSPQRNLEYLGNGGSCPEGAFGVLTPNTLSGNGDGGTESWTYACYGMR